MPVPFASRFRVKLKFWTPRGCRSLLRCARPYSQSANAGLGCLLVTSEDAMSCLAQLIQSIRTEGDCVCLYGDVGAGKSTFCRSYIRAACNDPYLAVPSPTFLLKNVYEPLEGPPVHHYDLYRLKELAHIQRLDLPSSFSSAATLIEWPQVAHPVLPGDRLNLHIRALPANVQASLKPEVEKVMQAARVSLVEEHGLDFVSGSMSEEEEDMRYEDVSWRAVALEARGSQWAAAVHAVLEAVETRKELAAEGLVLATPEVVDYLRESVQATEAEIITSAGTGP